MIVKGGFVHVAFALIKRITIVSPADLFYDPFWKSAALLIMMKKNNAVPGNGMTVIKIFDAAFFCRIRH